MEQVKDYLSILAMKAEADNPENPDDYKEDGLLYCGKCRTPKQCRPFSDKSITVFCTCRCKEQEEARLKAIRNADAIEGKRTACFTGYDGILKSDCVNTFAGDDNADSKASQAVRGFCNAPDGWLLLMGGTGTGKSFYAACICNELTDRGLRCRFTSVSEISDALWNAEDKAAVYGELTGSDLVVLDDLGAERSTEYMREITFRVIDNLLRAGMPVVITTNLSPKELMETKDTDLQRVYSRICKKAIPIAVTGADRRVAEMMTVASAKVKQLIEGGQDELCGYTEIAE